MGSSGIFAKNSELSALFERSCEDDEELSNTIDEGWHGIDDGVDDYFICRHNGEIYQAGEKVPSEDPCEHCRCSLVGGNVECTPAECPLVDCVDPEYPRGSCCGVCRWGSNCWLKERIIWGGQWVMEKVSSTCSMTCICPGFDEYAKSGLKTQAKCTNPCH